MSYYQLRKPFTAVTVGLARNVESWPDWFKRAILNCVIVPKKNSIGGTDFIVHPRTGTEAYQLASTDDVIILEGDGTLAVMPWQRFNQLYIPVPEVGEKS